VDSGFDDGDEVPGQYDSLVAKLVAWGPDREQARLRMLGALKGFEIEGIPTTIPAHRLLLEHPAFVDGSYTTRTVEGGALDALAAAGTGPGAASSAPPGDVVLVVDGTPVRLWHPAIARSISAATSATGDPRAGAVVAPMHGTILRVLVAAGDRVQAGEPVAVLEAMKMETQLTAGSDGVVAAVHVEPGGVVEAGQAVAVIE
jgi:acetyl-CoA/propionyl-CoA carboxylase biotin carboxyl carrier protein